jgi:polyisoprenoid-binding protein YceI
LAEPVVGIASRHMMARIDMMRIVIVRRLMAVCAALIAVAAIVSAMGTASADEAPAWTVDPTNSRIMFTGRQMGAPSKGEFKRFSANVNFDVPNLAASTVEVIIDLASADTGNRDIDEELKRPKWFDVQRFPKGRFVTTLFRAKNGNAYEAVARLTIRDVTREIVLPFVLDISQDSAGQEVARASGELTISRAQFGIGQAEWADVGIVADEVLIRIEIMAQRKK